VCRIVKKVTNTVIINVGNYQKTRSHISEDVPPASSLPEHQMLPNYIFNLVYRRKEHRLRVVSEKND